MSPTALLLKVHRDSVLLTFEFVLGPIFARVLKRAAAKRSFLSFLLSYSWGGCRACQKTGGSALRRAADFKTNAVPLLGRYLENECLLPRISKRVRKWGLTVYEELEIATCSGPFQETGRDFKRVGFDNRKE